MTTILIVEDEPDYMKIVSFQLASSGVQILGAHNGAEALKQAESNDVKIALLDCILPDTKGYELAQKLRALPGKERMSIIFATASEAAYADIPEMENMKKFLKPVSQNDLIQAIQSFL